jgi:hypothetical protein
LGSSERQGETTTYRFVSQDRDVYFNGDGPRREYVVPIRRDSECVINIIWGEDVPQKVEGKYVLVNRQTRKVLEVPDKSNIDGASLGQSEFNRGKHQQWDIAPLVTPNGDQSYFSIRNVHTGKAPDVANWSHDEGGKVQQWGTGSVAPQQWFFQYAGDNYFYIRNRWSTKYLQVAGGSKSDDAAIQQSSYTGAWNQQWRLVPAGEWAINFDPPQNPGGLRASNSPLGVELRWAANRDADLAGYTVFRSTTSGGPYDTIARGVTGNRFIDNAAKEQRKYYYAVKAVDHSLNQSAFSTEKSVTLRNAQRWGQVGF